MGNEEALTYPFYLKRDYKRDGVEVRQSTGSGEPRPKVNSNKEHQKENRKGKNKRLIPH